MSELTNNLKTLSANIMSGLRDKKSQPQIKQITVNELVVDVIQKNIKNVNLCVYPPHGRVRVSVPARMKIDAVRDFLILRLEWIKKKQAKLLAQEREGPKMYIDGESHYFKGKSYLLKIIEHQARARVVLNDQTIDLYIKPGMPGEKRKSILYSWYRRQLEETVPDFISQYEKLMDVEIREFCIKKMRTRWGTCNTRAKRIWLNLELAKKPIECLEYIVVHEMAHLLEPSHNKRFAALMDQYLPDWKYCKKELNRLPLK